MKVYIGMGKHSETNKCIEEATRGLSHPKLIVVISRYGQFKEVVEAISKKYPSAVTIGAVGCSIANTTTIKEGLVIWAIEEGIEVVGGVFEDISRFPIKYIKGLEENIKRIDAKKDNTVCLEFCTGAEEPVVTTLNAVLSERDISLIGGTTQGGRSDEVKYVALNGQLYEDACAYVLIKNNHGKIKVYKENIYTTLQGKEHIATKVDVENRRIIELDHQPAVKVYCKDLGIDKGNILKGILSNPLVRRVGTEEFIIAIKDVPADQSLACYKRVNPNDSIGVMDLDDYENVIGETIEAIKKDFRHISFIFSVNCIYRFLLFEEKNFSDRFSTLMCKEAPHVGTISDGEQFMNQHVNQTMLCVVFE